MPTYAYARVNVFTADRFGGNPLVVLTDARGLTDTQMQAIACEFNLSETAFVLPPDDPQHHARVRIFTPRQELPFAGHPNVGTGFVLARAMDNPPDHLVFEEIAGLVRVHMLYDEAHRITGTRISAPRSLSIGDTVPAETVAICASLRQDDILTTAHHPLFASVGTEFAIAEIANLEALSRAAPDLAAFHAVGGLAAKPAAGGQPRFALLLYARRDSDTTRLRARMFGPLGGILEDPATGSACAAVAGLLTSMAPGETVQLHFEIEQGVEMGRPSLLMASGTKMAEGPVTATVGGSCVPVGRGELEV